MWGRGSLRLLDKLCVLQNAQMEKWSFTNFWQQRIMSEFPVLDIELQNLDFGLL